MNRSSIPIHEIIVENRQRQDLGDIADLAESIKRFGLIQPIVISNDKKLIAGGRRLAAHQHLGLTIIDVTFKEALSMDELHEMELEENVRRKEMTWQERCLNIKTIHDLKQKRAALESQTWGQRETAEMLGIKGASNINYALKVAEYLLKKDSEILSCDSLSDALKVLLKRKENEHLAELNKRSSEAAKINSILPSLANASLSSFGNIELAGEQSKEPISDSSEEDAAREQYLKNPLNPPDEFDSYWKERIALRSEKEQHRNTFYLSKMLFPVDCIEFMQANPETFDAIITDIPYGISMDNLNQGNDGHAFKDISDVLAEHTVEGNEQLFERFFPAAFTTLKNNTFLITWCDQMQWHLMYNLATNAGFKVQRWPITWVKSHTCMNQSANTNFTKTTEIAMVCRKGTPTLCRTNIPSHIIASHDSYKEQLGHPFVKPFLLWEHLIDAITLEGHHVLEPFCGRGSGIISLLRKNRHVTGCEINTEHFNALMENVRSYLLTQNPNLTIA